MTGVELRADGNGGLTLEGYASKFGKWYRVSYFEECVRSGAFKRTISENADVSLLIDHSGLPLARTRAPGGGTPTLKLSEDTTGLRVEARLDPRNPRVTELQSVSEHSGLGMSFGFSCDSDRWSEDASKREILTANLHRGDVTATCRPASPSTEMEIVERSDLYSLEERRSLIEGMRGQRERRSCPGWDDVPLLDETRSGYSAAELAKLGSEGAAFLNENGSWSYPTKTVADWERAKLAVGRGGASHNRIRHYLIGRAKALGISHMVPDNWAPSGALKRSIEGPFECSACEGSGVCSACHGSGEVPHGPSRSAAPGIDYEQAKKDLARRGAVRVFAPEEARGLLQAEELRRLASRR